jgi:hypothetical protein
MKAKSNFVLALFLLLSSFSALAGQDSIPGQRPMLLLDNAFQFITGSWADYTYFDKQKNESTRLYFSILEREKVKNVPYIWMEIEAAVKDAPVVVTRVLIKETNTAPWTINQAIVQVQGYSPFSVPKKYLEGQDQQVGQFETAHIVKSLAPQMIEHKGKKINATSAEAETDKGDKMSITYSLDLPPIAVYLAENKDFRLSINDWGMDAQSKINGTPESFLMWVLEQVDNAFTTNDTKASGAQSFAGKWQTNFGVMTLTQNGTSVTGTFSGGKGSVEGAITDNVLSGTWTQGASDSGNEATSGDFEFVLSSDGNSFAGKWRRGSSGAWLPSPWNGTRLQP